MNRNAMQQLISWNTDTPDKAVLLTGAKGVGKTYLALDFAKNYYEQYLYVNFKTDIRLCRYIAEKACVVSSDFDICTLLCSYYQIPAELSHAILYIMDGIDICDEARAMLQECSGYRVIAIAAHSASLPLDMAKQFIHIKLCPLSFDEFLLASGREWYRDIITAHFEKMKRVPEIVHQELMDYFEEYLTVGGMPQAVNEYMLLETAENVSSCQQSVYYGMLGGIADFYDEGEALKQRQVLSVLEGQLSKENKKFQFNMIRKGASLQLYSRAIDMLQGDGNVIISAKLSMDRNRAGTDISLRQESSGGQEGAGTVCRSAEASDYSSFRIYPCDVGIYSCRLGSLPGIAFTESRKRSMLSEAFTVQELTATGHNVYYWESEARAKVDILADIGGEMIPCDIRTVSSNRSKSINVFVQNYHPPFTYRLWDKNFELSNIKTDNNNLSVISKCVPLYASFCL